VTDPFASFRLFRISLIRDLIKASPDKPLVTNEGWAANVEVLLTTMPLARRVERVSLDSRYDLRTRPSRVRPFADSMALYKFGRAFKGRKISPPLPPSPAEATAPRNSKPRERATS
jgi:hypothetical protein